MARTSSPAGNARTASSLNILAGAWLIIAPWVLGYAATAAMWNDVIVGIALVILAGVRAANPARYTGISWFNVLLGLWLILAPFILQYGALTAMGAGAAVWNDIVIGIAVVALAWSSAANTLKVERR